MGVYSRVKSDGSIEYALVNKGTSTLGDWGNNLQQPFGASDDMKDSIKYATDFVGDHPLNEVTMVGHSKGGAEAAANAVALDKNAILFNPATVALSSYGLSSDTYTGDMTAFIVQGEMLHGIFGAVSTPIDKLVYLPQQYKNNFWTGIIYPSYKNHGMESVISAL